MHVKYWTHWFLPCIFSGPKEKINSTFPYSGNLSSAHRKLKKKQSGERQDMIGYSLLHKVSERVCMHIITTVRSFLFSHLWTSHRARPSRTRSRGRERRRCGTAPWISRLGTGCGSACGSTLAVKWKKKNNQRKIKLNWTVAAFQPTELNRSVWWSLTADGFIFSSGSTIKRFFRK